MIFKGLPVEVLGAQLLLLPEVDRLVQYYSIASILCECLALGLHVSHESFIIIIIKLLLN